MSKQIIIGQKLYHYLYGSMTVTRINGNIITTAIDEVNGIRDKEFPIFNGTVDWFEDSVGHWIFEDIEDVGAIDNNFASAKGLGYSVDLITHASNKAHWHAIFSGKKGTISNKPSAVGVVSNAGVSEVGVVGNKTSSKISAVGVVD